MEFADRLAEVNERLAAHLDSVEAGSGTARDDLAVVLNLLIVENGGGLVDQFLQQEDREMALAAWPDDGDSFALTIPLDVEGIPPLLFGFRSQPSRDFARAASLDRFRDQVVVRWVDPELPPVQDYSLGQLIKTVRNKHGGHSDPKPPRWLTELRFLPVSDTDLITQMFWSYGCELNDAILEVLGLVDIQSFPRPQTRYLNGIDFSIGMMHRSENGDVEARCSFELEDPDSIDAPRTVIGGRMSDRPFVAGIDPGRKQRFMVGHQRESLKSLETRFRNEHDFGRTNRGQRRTRRNSK